MNLRLHRLEPLDSDYDPTNDTVSFEEDLMQGVYDEYYGEVDDALNSGADVRKVPKAIVVASKKGLTAIVKLLLDHGADIHYDADFALFWAVVGNFTDTVKVLLEHGAYVYGRTNELLTMAMEHRNWDMYELLKENSR